MKIANKTFYDGKENANGFVKFYQGSQRLDTNRKRLQIEISKKAKASYSRNFGQAIFDSDFSLRELN